MPASIITIAAGKGGVGKTTLTVVLATELSRQGKTVCIVDLDPQNTCAIALGLDDLDEGVADWIEGKHPFAATSIEGVRLLAGGPQLGRITAIDAKRLRAKFDTIDAEYVLVDTGHAWHQLSRVAYAAADIVLVVSDPHTLGLTGAVALLQRIEPHQMRAFALSKIDGRRTLHKQIQEHASTAFGEVPVFPVRSDAALERTLSEGLANTRLHRTRAVEDITQISNWIQES